MNIQTIWPAALELGKSPLWHAPSGRFFFVDIPGCALHAWHAASGQRQSWEMPERISWLIARRDGDGYMAGMHSGFARIWLEPQLRIEKQGSPHADQGDGRCISADGRRMLHADSGPGCVYEYRLSPAGEVMDKRLWKRFGGKQGTPYGMALDAKGNVWIAFWGGACLRQFSPDGALLQRIDLPALQPSGVAFGGDDLQSLVVTSARIGLTQTQLAQYPACGSVFLLRPGVAGLPPQTFG